MLAGCVDPAPAQEPTLSYGGLGAVKIGMTLPQAERALGAKLLARGQDPYDDDSCWYSSRVDKAEPGIHYMMDHDKIVRIDVFASKGTGVPATRSDTGFAIGASQAAIIARYGKAVQKSIHPYLGTEGSYLRVASPDHKSALLFETAAGKVTSLRAGTVPAVDFIEGCS